MVQLTGTIGLVPKYPQMMSSGGAVSMTTTISPRQACVASVVVASWIAAFPMKGPMVLYMMPWIAKELCPIAYFAILHHDRKASANVFLVGSSKLIPP
jgi:hypothetical protein